MGASWGGSWGASLVLGGLWGIWGALGGPCGLLKASWAHLGPSYTLSWGLWTSLGPLGCSLGGSWGRLGGFDGASWGLLSVFGVDGRAITTSTPASNDAPFATPHALAHATPRHTQRIRTIQRHAKSNQPHHSEPSDATPPQRSKHTNANSTSHTRPLPVGIHLIRCVIRTAVACRITRYSVCNTRGTINVTERRIRRME